MQSWIVYPKGVDRREVVQSTRSASNHGMDPTARRGPDSDIERAAGHAATVRQRLADISFYQQAVPGRGRLTPAGYRGRGFPEPLGTGSPVLE